jgi:hypothetical protein
MIKEFIIENWTTIRQLIDCFVIGIVVGLTVEAIRLIVSVLKGGPY